MLQNFNTTWKWKIWGFGLWLYAPMLTYFSKNWSMTPLFQGQIVSQADLVLEGFEWSMESNTENKKKV